MLFINIGGTMRLSVNEILSYASPNSSQIKKRISQAKAEDRYINITGRKSTLTILFTKSGYVYASPLRPETIDKRARQVEEATGGAFGTDDEL